MIEDPFEERARREGRGGGNKRGVEKTEEEEHNCYKDHAMQRSFVNET